MNKTATALVAIALAGLALAVAAPEAAAYTIVDCISDPEHPPAHCAVDCIPHDGELYTPVRCEAHE